MVTGGCDQKVRLWTRYVTSSPAGTLLGHCAVVLDVAIYPPCLRDLQLFQRLCELFSMELRNLNEAEPCEFVKEKLGNLCVLLPGIEGMGHFQSSLSKNHPPAVSLLANRSHPRTWQLPIPATEPPSS